MHGLSTIKHLNGEYTKPKACHMCYARELKHDDLPCHACSPGTRKPSHFAHKYSRWERLGMILTWLKLKIIGG